MSVDFQRGDLVQMPGDEASLGRVVEIRDYGIEIWVQPLDESRPQYYTYYDQLESMNPLDRIVREIERSDSATTFISRTRVEDSQAEPVINPSDKTRGDSQ